MSYRTYWLTIAAGITLVLGIDYGWRTFGLHGSDPAPLAAGLFGVTIGLALRLLNAGLSATTLSPGQRRLRLGVQAMLALAVWAAVSLGYTLLTGASRS